MVRTATRKKAESELEQIALPIEEAEVAERQVSIRVLTLGTRQITQTLYRQLIEEEVIDWKTGKLHGEIWGWVNLHEKDCGSSCHLHVIWENAGQLKRSCVFSSRKTAYWDTLSTRLVRLATIYVALIALDDKKFAGQENREKVTFAVKGRKITIAVPYKVRDLWFYATEIEQQKQAFFCTGEGVCSWRRDQKGGDQKTWFRGDSLSREYLLG
jgi:hypothetical protein